jgi:hypothetical protein
MTARLVRILALAALTVLLVVAPAPAGCGGDAAVARRAATVVVPSLGGALAAIHGGHQAAFDRAADALGAELRARGGTAADYDRRIAPAAAEFRARGEAIYTLDALLYAAAELVDRSAEGFDRAWMPMAARLTEALDRILRLLANGSILPAVPIPPAVLQLSGALRALAGPFATTPTTAGDAGTP